MNRTHTTYIHIASLNQNKSCQDYHGLKTCTSRFQKPSDASANLASDQSILWHFVTEQTDPAYASTTNSSGAPFSCLPSIAVFACCPMTMHTHEKGLRGREGSFCTNTAAHHMLKLHEQCLAVSYITPVHQRVLNTRCKLSRKKEQ